MSVTPMPQETPWSLATLGAPAVSFIAYGIPGPQGSKTSGVSKQGVRFMKESSAKVKPWRSAVLAAALDATSSPEWEPLDGPLVVDMVFTLPRPQSAPKTKRAWASKMPDVDKLMRSTGDALTGVVIKDDSRIVGARRLAKFYANDVDPDALRAPGAVVRVWQVG